MNLYHLSQTENRGYDTYDSCVVAAESEADAAQIHPGGYENWPARSWGGTWASKPEGVLVEYLGVAKEGTKRGIICSSFNAG